MDDNTPPTDPEITPPADPAAPPVAETPAPETPAPEPELTEEQKAEAAKTAKKQADIQKRMNAITRRGAEAERERDRLREELAATRALLEARKPDGEAAPTPEPTRTPSPDAVKIEAQRLREEERFQERTRELIANGAKELTPAVWDEKTEVLAQMGATQNPAFMQALAELPDGHKLVAHLAADLDGLQTLLAKPPVAMAAEMGRMLAQITAAPPRTLSTAPKPPPAPRGTSQAEPDVYDEKLSMKEYVALRRKQAPTHLGGERRRA
jgi:hypothetical protein